MDININGKPLKIDIDGFELNVDTDKGICVIKCPEGSDIIDWDIPYNVGSDMIVAYDRDEKCIGHISLKSINNIKEAISKATPPMSLAFGITKDISEINCPECLGSFDSFESYGNPKFYLDCGKTVLCSVDRLHPDSDVLIKSLKGRVPSYNTHIRYIGSYAFENLSVTSLAFPDNVKNFSTDAICNNPALQSVSAPGAEYLARCALRDNVNLETAVFAQNTKIQTGKEPSDFSIYGSPKVKIKLESIIKSVEKAIEKAIKSIGKNKNEGPEID